MKSVHIGNSGLEINSCQCTQPQAADSCQVGAAAHETLPSISICIPIASPLSASTANFAVRRHLPKAGPQPAQRN
jgi:hypothetical protein